MRASDRASGGRQVESIGRNGRCGLCERLRGPLTASAAKYATDAAQDDKLSLADQAAVASQFFICSSQYSVVTKNGFSRMAIERWPSAYL